MFGWFKKKEKEDSTAAKLREVNEKLISDWVSNEEQRLVELAERRASQGSSSINIETLKDTPMRQEECYSRLIKALRKHKFKSVRKHYSRNWISFRW